MPRYRRRSYARRGSVMPLVLLLLLAVVLLILIRSGQVLTVNLPNLPHIELPQVPNITIPITGLPEIKIPSVSIPVTVEPGTLIPGVVIGGTPAPAGAPVFGARTKTTGCQVQDNLPDPACSPGSVMNTNTAEVCRAGYASSVRDVPQSVKDEVYQEYGIPNHTPGAYEVDHLIPLSLGGSNDIANLWPQPASPLPGYQQKDAVENYLHDQVCSGKMSLKDAQQAIASNWVEVYHQKIQVGR